AAVLQLGKVPEHIEDPRDMVQVDMADHHHPQIKRAFAAQFVEAGVQYILLDGLRSPADQDDLWFVVGSVVQHEAVAIVCLKSFQSEHNDRSFSQSDCLQGAENVEHAGTLEPRFAPEVGGGLAQDFLDTQGLADQFAVSCHQQSGGAADMGRSHTG